jgi:hypothetical protein
LRNIVSHSRKLDPYEASSLLQKGIRRGETDLAAQAARALSLQRGKAAWRRLLVVAFEDVGIGDTSLVRHVTELACAHLSKSGGDIGFGHLKTTTELMCAAAKNRGTDHLTCSAASLLLRRALRPDPASPTMGEVIEIAADPGRSLVDRAIPLVDTSGLGQTMFVGSLSARLKALGGFIPAEAADLIDASISAFAVLRGTFVLTLPLLIAAKAEDGLRPIISDGDCVEPEWIDGLPSYVFDKHTALGKRAISIFARENADLANELSQYVIPENHAAVARMAAFYVDGVPLARELRWSGSIALERKGLEADMAKAGCPPCGIDPIISCVGRNLDHLNDIRSNLRCAGNDR